MTNLEKLLTTDCVTVEDYKERLDELRQEQEDLMKKIEDPRPAIRSAEEVIPEHCDFTPETNISWIG